MALTASEIQLIISARDDASAALQRVEASVGGLGNAAANVAKTLATGLAVGTAAVAAGLGAAANSAAGFEQTMSGVKAVSAATADQMTQLSGLALQLGKDTVFSASDAGKGIEELVKGGVSIDDVMNGAAKATLNLASAGGVDLVTAATIASNALNGFNLKGEDMAHVANVISGAANASAIDVQQFGDAMAQSSAVAATVGISFDDLSVAIAEMGNAGIKGQDAGTSLKTMLLALTPSSKQAAAEMRTLGIVTADGANRFFDAQGHAKGLADISGILADATKNLSDEQKVQALQTIFGTDAVRAAAVMAKNGAEGFDTLADSMSKVTAESVSAERLNNLRGDIEQLKGSVDTAAITLGTALLPALRGATQGATAFVNGLIPFIEDNGPAMVTVLQNAGSAVLTFGDDLKGNSISALSDFRQHVDDAGAALAPWAAQAGESGTAVSEALTGVNGVALGLQELLQGNFKAAAKDASDGMSHLGTAADEMADVVKGNAIDALDGFRQKVGDASAALSPWAAEAGKSGDAVSEALTGVDGVARGLQELLRGDFKAAAQDAGDGLGHLGTAANEMASVVKDQAIGALDDFRSHVDDASAALAPWAATAGEKGKAVSDALSGVNDVATTLEELLKGDFKGAAASASAALDDFKTAAQHAATELREDLQPALEGVRGALKTTSDEAAKRGVWDDLTESVGGLKKAGDELSDAFGGLVSALGGGRPAVQGTGGDFNLAAEMLKYYSQQAKSIADGAASIAAGVKLVGDAFNTVGQAADNAGGAVQRLKNTIASGGFSIPNIGATAVGAAVDIGRDIGNGLASGITGQAGQVSSAGAALGTAAIDGAGNRVGAHSPARAFIELGGDIVDGLVMGLEDGVGVADAGADLANQTIVGAQTVAAAPVLAKMGSDAAAALAAGLKSKNPDIRAAAKEMARQAQIAVQEAAPVDTFIVAGVDMGDGISLGLLRGVEKAKTAAGTYGDSILGELQSFTTKVQDEISKTAAKLDSIDVAVAKSIDSALSKESDAIDASISKMHASLDTLVINTNISADTSGRKGALSDQIAQETLIHNAVAAADELAYQHTQDLAKAAAKLQTDLSAATTAAKRADLQTQYSDQVANLNASYNDAVGASQHRQTLDAADRAFKATEDAKVKALDDQLAGEALARQISTIIAGQAADQAAAQQKYTDAVTLAHLTADTERGIALLGYDQKISDLKKAFLDQIPALEGPALDAFNAFMDNVTSRTTDFGNIAAQSLGRFSTTVQDTLGDGGDVPQALNVTDRALDDAAKSARSTLGNGGAIPTSLQQTANSAKSALGNGGTVPVAARDAVNALGSVAGAAGDPLTGPLNLLKDAAAKLGSGGLAVAADAAKDLEGQFPGLTDAVNAWIATLGGIPKSITTDIIANISANGSLASAVSGGGSGGGSSSSKNLGSTAGKPGSFTLPNIVTGGTITVSGNNLGDAINNAAKATGVSSAAQAGGGTFGNNTQSGLSFAVGGLVPGPVGAPVKATVHGGEYVLPVSIVQSVTAALRANVTTAASSASNAVSRAPAAVGIDPSTLATSLRAVQVFGRALAAVPRTIAVALSTTTRGLGDVQRMNDSLDAVPQSVRVPVSVDAGQSMATVQHLRDTFRAVPQSVHTMLGVDAASGLRTVNQVAAVMRGVPTSKQVALHVQTLGGAQLQALSDKATTTSSSSSGTTGLASSTLHQHVARPTAGSAAQAAPSQSIDYDRLGAAVAKALHQNPPRIAVEDVRSSLIRVGQRNSGTVGLA